MKNNRTNGKLIFAGLLILFIGTMYLILQLTELSSSETNFFGKEKPRSDPSWNEILFDLRSYIYILFGLTGGIGLLKGKKWGWILGVPYLLLYLILASWAILRLAKLDMMNEGGYLMVVAWILLFIALFFLLKPSTLKTLKIRPLAFISTAFVALFFFWLYFYMQLT